MNTSDATNDSTPSALTKPDVDTDAPSPGGIITFYSYKGGTGRSMALANIACLLAESHPNDRILAIDWDLEAPGLHRYFRNHISRKSIISDHADAPGLIDLFVQLDKASGQAQIAPGDAGAAQVSRLYDRIGIDKFVLATDIGGLHVMKAGRFDERYPSTVNTFDWSGLFRRSEWLIRMFAEKLRERYRYVLIDSRTGITDTSGICTTMLPDKLVVIFTPNRQSLTGIEDLVRRALQYRRASPDIRPLVVYPVPSRVESTRPLLRERWRFSNGNDGINGYQPMFEHLFRDIYKVPECDLHGYFDEVQIQHVADYAYGEEIAVLIESKLSQDRFSLTRSFGTVTSWLVDHPAPWSSPESQTDIAAPTRTVMQQVLAWWRGHWQRRALPAFAAAGVTGFAALSAFSVHWPDFQQAVSAASDAAKEIRLLRDQAARERENFTAATRQLSALQSQLALAEDAAKRMQQSDTLVADLRLRLTRTEEERRKSEAQVARLNELVRNSQQMAPGAGWEKILAEGSVSSSEKSTRVSPLVIDKALFLWAERITQSEVEFRVNSSAEGSRVGQEFLHVTLLKGGSSYFIGAKREYRVTLIAILEGPDPARNRAAVFSVDGRELSRRSAISQGHRSGTGATWARISE